MYSERGCHKMPLRSPQYTLVGFSAELDWRPVRFVDPLPQNSVCDFCGLVRPKTASIPCGHALCITCYKQCAQDGLRVCPLDDCECQDEEVEWNDFPVEQLLQKEIHCWNAASGCQYLAEASRISRHFHLECGHHSIPCPKCSIPVPCSRLVTHVKSGLCHPAAALPVDRTERQTKGDYENAILVSFSAAVGKQADEVKEFLGRIAEDIQTYGDRLNSICHGLNSLRETLRRDLGVGTRHNPGTLTPSEQGIAARIESANECLSAAIHTLQTLSESITRLQQTLTDEVATAATQSLGISQTATAIREVTTAVKRNHREALNLIRSIQCQAELGISQCVFFVRNVQSLERKAKKKGSGKYESNTVYLRGYCVKPGVEFRVDNETLVLHATLRLLSGEMDDEVDWPFEHTIKLAVMHPKQGAELAFQVKTSRSLAYYQRPPKAGNSSVCLNAAAHNITDLNTGGYVEDDQLRVKYQLLP